MNDEHPMLKVPPAVARVERIISSLLRVGVTISLGVIVMGTVISFAHHPGYLWSAKDLPVLTNPTSAGGGPHALREVLAGAFSGHGQPLVMLGLLLLIATPVLRVAVSIFAFLFQLDWVFAVLTAVVLGFLVVSFFLGRVEG